MALTASATVEILTGQRAKGGTPFVVTGYSTDASTADAVKAAPGVNKSILIDAVILTSNDADAFPWLQDEDDKVIFGRFFTQLTSGGPMVINKRFPNPLKLVSNKALELKAAAAGNVSVYVEGRIQDDVG
jgi:hypothetical protein